MIIHARNTNKKSAQNNHVQIVAGWLDLIAALKIVMVERRLRLGLFSVAIHALPLAQFSRRKAIRQERANRRVRNVFNLRVRQRNGRVGIHKFKNHLTARAARAATVRRYNCHRGKFALPFGHCFENRIAFRANGQAIGSIFDITARVDFSRR